jgi:chromodomain-helicase-DNA-binding protein 1
VGYASDLNDVNQEEKIMELHQQLESLMLRRLKRDLLSELPTKSARILRVEMSALQTLFYKNILTKVTLRLICVVRS